jgi:hypothetical protein
MNKQATRKVNPGLYWTRKEAVLAAIAKAQADPGRTFNKRGEWFVVGGGRRWGIVALKPTGSMSIGPITIDNGEKYRRWYAA